MPPPQSFSPLFVCCLFHVHCLFVPMVLTNDPLGVWETTYVLPWTTNDQSHCEYYDYHSGRISIPNDCRFRCHLHFVIVLTNDCRNDGESWRERQLVLVALWRKEGRKEGKEGRNGRKEGSKERRIIRGDKLRQREARSGMFYLARLGVRGSVGELGQSEAWSGMFYLVKIGCTRERW